MKIIERDTNFSVPLPHLRIGAEAFIDILSTHAQGTTPEIILGELTSPSRIQLLGMRDIEAHLHLVKVPLTANIGTIRLNLRQRWGAIACEAQDRDRACAILSALAPHQPRGLALTRDSVFYAAMAGVFALPFVLPEGTAPALALLEQLAAACLLIAACFTLKHFIARNRITPVEAGPQGEALWAGGASAARPFAEP